MYTISIKIEATGSTQILIEMPLECTGKQAEKLKRHIAVIVGEAVSDFGKQLYESKRASDNFSKGFIPENKEA